MKDRLDTAELYEEALSIVTRDGELEQNEVYSYLENLHGSERATEEERRLARQLGGIIKSLSMRYSSW